ncbi:hypothetical protein ACS81_00310 [Vibrio parahaemolyticus]|uniref:hypothetical protein n=1 Tax=Vibrio TaxID=662 RepID=UPI0006A6D902|nr:MULTISPECIES: hypothetical protein [Vibrio]KOE09187.1 hypothetical protein ACS81_00310 [Vibrio parahaemolyticus]MCR9645964.1 hypothetical protein [Vibrio parahaemolyticus]MDF4526827.1 hypothetical protein [Vibrio parahaemolyticus]MDF4553984.1 hypothetical protein [Vibrio parahaemolyticus]RZP96579.1 hypothetical protein D8T54_10585 [Vibrio vulnificus]
MKFIKNLKTKKKAEIHIYQSVVSACLERLFDMIFCARFMFFAIVTIAIGTTGIWVPVLFQIDLSSVKSICETIQASLGEEGVSMPAVSLCSKPRVIGLENFSMFMYVVGILGMLAAEFFIKGKAKAMEESDVKLALLSFCMLVWFLALALSFWGLKMPTEDTWQLKVSVWLTVSLWLSSIYTDGGFHRDSLKVLSGDTSSKGDNKSQAKGSDFMGDGMND